MADELHCAWLAAVWLAAFSMKHPEAPRISLIKPNNKNIDVTITGMARACKHQYDNLVRNTTYAHKPPPAPPSAP